MKQPAISIIVPVYNAEKYLRRCIDSILSQSLTDFELILIDDGSTDRSPHICDEYATRDKRIKLIHKKNAGVSAARNNGIDMASGDYLVFIDGDDWIASNMLEIMYKNIQKEKPDIINFNAYKHIEGKNIEKFLKRLHTSKIELLKIQYPSRKEAIIKIYLKDYEKVLQLKTIYEIQILNYGGYISFSKKIKRNRFFLITCFLGLFFLYFLSHVIFEVEVIHTDKDLRILLLEELEQHGIKKYQFTKSFKEVEEIKKEIINKYRDTIEWLEIERVNHSDPTTPFAQKNENFPIQYPLKKYDTLLRKKMRLFKPLKQKMVLLLKIKTIM